MVISKLSGGLGNQMFQYALAKALSIKNRTTLKIDLSFYENQQVGEVQRKYLLYNFNIDTQYSSQNDIDYVLNDRSYLELLPTKIYKQIIPYYKRNYIIEKDLFFDKNIFKARKNVILEGYWPNENYFKSIESIIRREFTLRSESVTNEYLNLKNDISVKNSVSIHIRRTDYLNNKNGNFDLFGICDVEYYDRAIEYVVRRINDPFFFVFSDDVNWVKENFALSFPNYLVSGRCFNDVEEMLLMSFCKYNILANSTYSWWAAWLNVNPNKQVFAPKQWYNSKILQNFYETSDFMPTSWNKL